MECPKCRLENPPGSSTCDCGYEFSPRLRLGRGGELLVGRESLDIEVKTFTYRRSFGQYSLIEGWQSKTMDEHTAELLADGWQVLQSHSGGGHVNVGRTAMRIAALGLPVLLFGASRADTTLTLTFTRSRGPK